MNAFLILGILLIGILLGLVKGDARHLVLRLSHHRRIQLFVRKEIIQIHITNHGRFKEIHVFMTGIRVVSYKHMPRGAHQYRFYVDGTEQRSKKHTSIHTVDLRGLQGVIERAHTLWKDHIAGKARIGDRAITELTLLQYIPQGINLPVHHFGTSLIA